MAEANAFPVIAYVAGPSEIAYLAQSQVLFEMHGVPAPVVVPRAAFQLVEPKVARVLDRLGVQPEELKGDRATAIRRLLNQRTPADLQESLERLRRAVGEALSDVEGAAVNFDPGARSAVGSGKKAVYDGIEALEAKLQAKVRERNAVLEQQLEKVAVNLFPEGVRQERALTAYPYLIRYGESLLDRLYAKVATPLD